MNYYKFFLVISLFFSASCKNLLKCSDKPTNPNNLIQIFKNEPADHLSIIAQYLYPKIKNVGNASINVFNRSHDVISAGSFAKCNSANDVKNQMCLLKMGSKFTLKFSSPYTHNESHKGGVGACFFGFADNAKDNKSYYLVKANDKKNLETARFVILNDQKKILSHSKFIKDPSNSTNYILTHVSWNTEQAERDAIQLNLELFKKPNPKKSKSKPTAKTHTSFKGAATTVIAANRLQNLTEINKKIATKLQQMDSNKQPIGTFDITLESENQEKHKTTPSSSDCSKQKWSKYLIPMTVTGIGLATSISSLINLYKDKKNNKSKTYSKRRIRNGKIWQYIFLCSGITTTTIGFAMLRSKLKNVSK
ncbi:hypothetical protein KAU11_03405 [Candidatus Babeliales bacterium]|nr:hypothetical protein [Candidatus Babeliales bacterium]